MATIQSPPSRTSRAKALDTVAAILAGLTPTAAYPLLIKTLATIGIVGTAATAAIRLYTGEIPAPLPEGAAGTIVAQGEADYRAAFLIASAQRIQAALADGDTLAEAVQAEQRYWDMHKFAVLKRALAARQVDRSARIYGDRLGWYLGQRKTHTPVCEAAAGHDFSATQRPLAGFPGTSHNLCGCHAGPPFYSRQSVDDVTRPLLARGLD